MYETFTVNENVVLGPWTSYSMQTDPKHMAFVLSRYKFCSKMLRNYNNILEVGCGDAFGASILAQDNELLVGIDNDDVLESNKSRVKNEKINFASHDILSGPYISNNKFDAAVSIDVIEHIEPSSEDIFIENIINSLSDKSMVIIGTPNVTSVVYASPQSKYYHINLYSHDKLNNLMKKHFTHVLNFGMNDEIVHTGFGPMCHYLFSVGLM